MSLEKVLIGMSGGVDSSAAALILKQNSYNVAGVTLELFGNNDQNISDSKSVCKLINIPHYTIDLKDDFSNLVIKDFIQQYKNSNTPNPCVVCNKYIKFGKMIERAIEMGFDKIATGHYARIEKREDGRFILKKAVDSSKDQSYMLYSLTQEQLSHTLFPLGDYTKSEVREIAEKAGFINADRPDSQDICFVSDGDYAKFIEYYDKYVSQIGEFVDINGNILGKHKGIINYTIGQRKGLGIALGKRTFVIDKNELTNRVVLGDEIHLFKDTVRVKDVNWIPFDKLEREIKVTAKLRYRHREQAATIYPSDDEVIIKFDQPQRAPTSGQAAVFYDGDIVVGGGTII